MTCNSIRAYFLNMSAMLPVGSKHQDAQVARFSFPPYHRYNRAVCTLQQNRRYWEICCFQKDIDPLFHLPFLRPLLCHQLQLTCLPLSADQCLTASFAWFHNILSKISPGILSAMKISKDHSLRYFSVTCGRLPQSVLPSSRIFSDHVLYREVNR